MKKLENVIKGLGCHVADPEGKLNCENCPYSAKATGDNSISNSAGCLNRLHMDALELLKDYQRKCGSPCMECKNWNCDDVCDKYIAWKEKCT